MRSLQRRIVQAVQAGAWRQVKRLSYRLVHSFAARALAVKRVTEHPGRNHPLGSPTSPTSGITLRLLALQPFCRRRSVMPAS